MDASKSESPSERRFGDGDCDNLAAETPLDGRGCFEVERDRDKQVSTEECVREVEGCPEYEAAFEAEGDLEKGTDDELRESISCCEGRGGGPKELRSRSTCIMTAMIRTWTWMCRIVNRRKI